MGVCYELLCGGVYLWYSSLALGRSLHGNMAMAT